MPTYPLDFPNVRTNAQSLGYITNNLVNASSETFQTQVVEKPGQMWRLDIGFPSLADAEARTMWAFLTKLKGRLGTFYYTPKDAIKGTAAGTITVQATSGVYRQSVTLAGGSGTGCLLEGDFVQIGTQLVQVLTQYNGGTQAVDIFPCLRFAPSVGQAVITNNPKGIFRLQAADTAWDLDISKRYLFSLSAVEAV